jgi:DNA-binding NarL/FixJ family response regulator
MSRLIDLQMPEMSGPDALTAIRAAFPAARVTVLTTLHGRCPHHARAQSRSICILAKNLFCKELLTTIRPVHAGKKTLSPEVSHELAEHAVHAALSPAEGRVLRLIGEGKSNREIAAHLLTNEDSIKNHVNNIPSKLGANDRTRAVVIAMKRGIIEL